MHAELSFFQPTLITWPVLRLRRNWGSRYPAVAIVVFCSLGSSYELSVQIVHQIYLKRGAHHRNFWCRLFIKCILKGGLILGTFCAGHRVRWIIFKFLAKRFFLAKEQRVRCLELVNISFQFLLHSSAMFGNDVGACSGGTMEGEQYLSYIESTCMTSHLLGEDVAAEWFFLLLHFSNFYIPHKFLAIFSSNCSQALIIFVWYFLFIYLW